VNNLNSGVDLECEVGDD